MRLIVDSVETLAYKKLVLFHFYKEQVHVGSKNRNRGPQARSG
jgi:hypothetical protein